MEENYDENMLVIKKNLFFPATVCQAGNSALKKLLLWHPIVGFVRLSFIYITPSSLSTGWEFLLRVSFSPLIPLLSFLLTPLHLGVCRLNEVPVSFSQLFPSATTNRWRQGLSGSDHRIPHRLLKPQTPLAFSSSSFVLHYLLSTFFASFRCAQNLSSSVQIYSISHSKTSLVH